MTKSITIIGSDDYNPNKSDIGTGAFPAGRIVKLSPFIMGKYEVTQELYKAVMTGQIAGDNKLEAMPSICNETDSDYSNMLADEEQKYRPVENVS